MKQTDEEEDCHSTMVEGNGVGTKSAQDVTWQNCRIQEQSFRKDMEEEKAVCGF